jgi:acyl-CoA synthetase (AMP-forming)/AMP-acid ligase II/thioesterase domain-containing protein/acyl carrier protein
VPPAPLIAPLLAETTMIVRHHAASQPSAAAILDWDRKPLTYSMLSASLAAIGEHLRGCGIGPGDRVAIVLPNGPEMAVCFLAVAGIATAAPLNPAFRRSEFDFYLSDLRAKALIVAGGIDSPSREAAQALAIPVLELERDSEHAGAFKLSQAASCSSRDDRVDDQQEAALVLHTSGTTARPKIVPLTQRNLCASAANISASLGLTPADRCLNVMPLFHIHGLVGALLSTMHAGGSVVCAGTFDADRCFDGFEQLRPTWYTAVPTMHQAIITAAARRGSRPEHSLRFIRSCSSALPPTVLSRLEHVFDVPVVEAYGMTEAAHQMACNPLPPRKRKPGSVGVPTGVAVAIMDQTGQLLPAGVEGEVVIQGASVTAGYESNPQANFTAFEQGWFRTGDQGRMDAEGYLFLTGRIKELINRGGEKISPREIDEAILSHPDVAQAMAFALPHPTLGEDIAAAVVPREGRTVDPSEIRRHVAGILAEFKTPQCVVVVTEIPKGPTGKPQRIGLAEKLGLTGDSARAPAATADPPRDGTERRLAALWSEVLQVTNVSRTDNFFARGGDSLMATMLLALVEKAFHVTLPIRVLFEAGGLAEMAASIETLPTLDRACAKAHDSLVPFQTRGERPPFFMVHPHSGRSIGIGHIAPHLSSAQPYYGFAARGMDGRRLPHRSLQEMAAAYIMEVRAVQPEGPYLLGGFCAGGIVAYEMAQQLTAAGACVAQLVMIDSAHPRYHAPPAPWLQASRAAKLAARRAAMRIKLALGSPPSIKLGERIVNETMRRGVTRYAPKPYSGRLALMRSDMHHRTDEPHLGWLDLATQGIELIPFAGDHKDPWTPNRIGPAARRLQACLEAALTSVGFVPNVDRPLPIARMAA